MEQGGGQRDHLNADFLYSTTLMLALAAGGAAILAAAVRRWGSGGQGWNRAVQVGAGVAWAALFVSFFVHLARGHTPGGPAALPVREFVLEHEAFVAAALLPGLALLLGRRGGAG